MDRYAVLGNPIGHSLSPEIHRRFAEQTGQTLQYVALEVPLDGFPEFVADLRAEGFRGMNVTVPFKQEAFALSESLSDRARAAGAVNTLIRTDTGWRGENTDGAGLVRDLTRNLGLALRQHRLLLLGAGGAARGVVQPLLAEQPALLHIANRTTEKARQLVASFPGEKRLAHSGLDGPFHAPYDLIINATAASLKGVAPAIPDGLLAKGGAIYDMMYSDRPTAFIEWGRGQGAAIAADGLGMLVEQAAESFHLWRGVRPDTRAVLTAMRPGGQPSS